MNFIFTEVKENIDITQSRDQTPYTMPEVHYHDCYEIIFFLSGHISYFIKDEMYTIAKYDLIFIPPFDLHKLTHTYGKYYERIVVNFKKTIFSDTFINSGVLNFFMSNIHKVSITDNDIKNIFTSLSYEKKINDIFSDMRIKLLLEELLILLNRETKQNTSKPEGDIKDEKALSIISYINENYMENITIQLLSSKFYISKSYLVHLFKYKTGFTIMEYLNKKRISVAQQMLSTKEYNIRDVGGLVGYNNLTSFSRTFKQIAGISPMQYKKHHRFK